MVRRVIPGVVLTLIGVVCLTLLAQAQTGRWKLDGNGGCYFDANDDGFDQCAPPSGTTTAAGRWKDDGNGGCVFDAADEGPDQCSPTAGRWKLDGDGGCVFDANDSGPNQCPPPNPTEPDPAATDRVD